MQTERVIVESAICVLQYQWNLALDNMISSQSRTIAGDVTELLP